MLLKATSNIGDNPLALAWANVAMQEATQARALQTQAVVWVYRAWPLARQEQGALR